MNFIVMDDNPSRPAIKEMGLPLRVRPILLIMHSVWLQTELDFAQCYCHYKLSRQNVASTIDKRKENFHRPGIKNKIYKKTVRASQL